MISATLLFSLLGACGTPNPAMPVGSSQRAPDRGAEVVRFTSEESAAKNLPPMAFHFDPSGTQAVVMKYNRPETYVDLAGTSGSILSMRVEAYRLRTWDVSSLMFWIKKKFGDPEYQPVTVGVPANLSLGGAERVAIPFVTGKDLARTNWCGLLVPPVSGDGEGLIVLLGTASEGEPDCAISMGHPRIAPFVSTFGLD